MASNRWGAAFWDDPDNSSSILNERGMSSSSSKERVVKPEQTCSGDPDNDWATTNNWVKNNCEVSSEDTYADFFTFLIVSKSDEEFTLEWTIFGWK